MKRIFALILCTILVFSLDSCQSTLPSTNTQDRVVTEEKQTKENEKATKTEEHKENETTEKSEKSIEVNEPLTWDRIRAIPIANASMSIDQLRKICVDFFALQVSFAWTPKDNATYVVDSFNHKVNYQIGGLYGGIPYVNLGSNNLYRVMDFYDPETGVFDVKLLETNEKLTGNACSSSAGIAWGRVINSASLSYTSGHTPKAGFLPLGPYVSNMEISTFGTNDQKIDVGDILKQNDTQTMYQSYALLKPADGIVSAGHVRMAKEAAHVIYNDDGTINGEESYCVFVEQGCFCDSAAHTRTQADGTKYQIQGNDNYKASFAELAEKYLPFTFAEFLGTDPVEKSKISLSTTDPDLTVSALLKAKVKSNYIMTDLYCIIRDAAGNQVFKYAFRQPKHYLKTCDLSSVCPVTYLQKYAKEGTYTVEFSAQLSTGERTVFYSGILT